ncbi:TPA: MgtC/SapB family protein [Candidatus Avigastranaerophilus faecigallinarum]|nr:MgtC/SapB family protein [Candidatus Avigastranaerophilus faecigallinarum]
MQDILHYIQIENADILLRIIFSIILGSIIGLERELTNKSAGLRTQIMVCLGSCLFTILSIYGFSTAVTLYPLGDPSRVAAQIITGIGFIGAGTVLRQGLTVTGLTTASTLWIVAAIGMACGCGKLNIAIVSTILAVAILVLIRMFEMKIMPKNLKHLRKIKISFVCKYDEYNEIYKKLVDLFPEIIDYNHKTVDEDGDMLKINAKVFSTEKSPVIHIYRKLEDMKNLQSVSVKEIFD